MFLVALVAEMSQLKQLSFKA